MKEPKYTQEELNEAIKVAEANGYKVGERKPTDEEIAEAIKVAEANGLKVIKEDEDAAPADTTPADTTPADTTPPEGEDDGELFTIQVTKAELEAIKSIIDKVEYEDDGSSDAEQAAAVVDAMDNENVYGAYPEE